MSALARAERELCRRSLYSFARLAWPHTEPSPYVDNWHIESICDLLQGVSEACEKSGEAARPRELINVPPGTGKSLLTGVFWPAWDWIRRPWRQFMFVSYDLSLLVRDARKLLDLITSPWYRERFGEMLDPQRSAATDFGTRGGGGRFSTTFRGKATGRHAHIQAIDDPIKPISATGDRATGEETDFVIQALANTFASRAKDPETFARLMIMQRVSEGDPSDWALSQGWRHTCYPMIKEVDHPYASPEDPRAEGEPLFPARFPEGALASLKKDLGDSWDAQYQQLPAAKGGQIIHPDWIDRYSVTKDELPESWGRQIQSWDLTFKASEGTDFVAGQPWASAWIDGEDHYFLTTDSPVFERLSFVNTLREIRARRATWPAAEILVEDKANGPALESVLKEEWPGVLRLVNPQGSKRARLHSVAPKFSSGRVHLLRGAAYDRLRSTLIKFPRVRRDDEVDALSQALGDLTKHQAHISTLLRIGNKIG